MSGKAPASIAPLDGASKTGAPSAPEPAYAGVADRAPTRDPQSENFPVASIFLRPHHRRVILAFYRFARRADDIADDPARAPGQKQAELAAMGAALKGSSDADSVGVALRAALGERNLSNAHALDLLAAFQQDTVKSRYEDWDALMAYCRLSAAPVGRFLLDVHGEPQSLWPQSDALCAALQVINHLQDCRDDFQTMDRVYLPQDALTAAGAATSALAAPAASPALRAAIASVAARTQTLLDRARGFSTALSDRRLGLEVAIIQRLAQDLNARLLVRDPLSERVRHRKWESASLAMATAASWPFVRARRSEKDRV